MNVKVLDKNLDVVSILDSYQSLIWTDRYEECGDFEIVILPSAFDQLQYITMDSILLLDEAQSAMIVESIVMNTDAEEGNEAVISGRSLDSILDRRIIWGQAVFKDTVDKIIYKLLNDQVINPAIPIRKIPNFTYAKPSMTIPTDVLDIQFNGDNLYEAISSLCYSFDYGFKIEPDLDNKRLVFRLYSGVDRSYNQIDRPIVEFSPSFDNLASSGYVSNLTNYKNVVLVSSDSNNGPRRLVSVGLASGLDRRETYLEEYGMYDTVPGKKNYLDVSKIPSTSVKGGPGTINNGDGSITVISNKSDPTCDPVTTLKAIAPDLVPGETYILDANTTGTKNLIYLYESKREWYFGHEATITEKDLSSRFTMYASGNGTTAVISDLRITNVLETAAYDDPIDEVDYLEQLKRKGIECLYDSIPEVGFTGEASAVKMYQYGRDFFIGDVVQFADIFGNSGSAQVTEFIISDDANGTSMYPTFRMIGGI